MNRSFYVLLCAVLMLIVSVGAVMTVGALRDGRNADLTEDSVALIAEGQITLKKSEQAAGAALPVYHAFSDPRLEDAKTAMLRGFDEYSDRIDLLEYRLTSSELNTVFGNLLNTTPELFYVRSGYSYSYVGGIISALLPGYVDSAAECGRMRAEYETMVDELFSRRDPSFTPLESVLFFHDLIASEFEYDTSYSIYDAYHFLKERRGVCQAYTLTYMSLLNRCGIENSYAESDSMHHIWNTVRLDGEWYHVDITWDDPLADRFGGAMHSSFLRSTAAISDPALGSKRHYDFVSPEGVNCTSTRFDQAPFEGAENPLAFCGGKWYMVQTDTGEILRMDLHANRLETTAVYTIPDVWRVWNGGGRYYPKKYASLFAWDGKLWYTSPTGILSLDLSGGNAVSEYVLPAAEEGYIYFARAAGDGIDFLVCPSASCDPMPPIRHFSFPGAAQPDPALPFHLWNGETFLGSFASAEEAIARMNRAEASFRLAVSAGADGRVRAGTVRLPASKARRLTVVPFEAGREDITLVMTGASQIGAELTLEGLSIAGESGASVSFTGKYLTVRNTVSVSGVSVTAADDSLVTLHGTGPVSLSGSLTADELALDCSLLLSGTIRTQVLSLAGDTTAEGSGNIETEILRGDRRLTLAGETQITVSDACECGIEYRLGADPGTSVLFIAPELAREDAKLTVVGENGREYDMTALLSCDGEGRYTVRPYVFDTEGGEAKRFASVGMPMFLLPEEITSLGAGSFADVPFPMLLVLHGNVTAVAPDAIGENVTVLVPDGSVSEETFEPLAAEALLYTREEENGWTFLLLEEQGTAVCVDAPASSSVILPVSRTGRNGSVLPVTVFDVTLHGNVFSRLPSGSDAEASAKRCLAPDASFYGTGEWFTVTVVGGETVPVPAQRSPADFLTPRAPGDPPEGYEYRFDGWDLNGDGKPDPLPAKMTADLTAAPVFTPVEKGSTGPTVSYLISGNTLRALARGTETQALRRTLERDCTGVTIVSPAGKTLNPTDPVPTGATVTLTGKDGKKKTLTVIVTGDLNGDGSVTLTDFVQFRALLFAPASASAAKTQAADLNGDGKATLTDFMLLRSFLLKKTDIVPR